MKEPKRILFLSQEIYPYLAEETPIRMLNRRLPEMFQQKGFETRTFMPKFGDINERRNQLHEVIRLSGMNLIIDDTDHPLLIKVASIQSARIQVYFTDNDDLFHRRKGIADENGVEYPDNDKRCIFFARGVLETVKKQHWTPNIIHCSGWMTALAPLFLKRTYSDEPFFANAKVVLVIDDQEYQTPFSTKFAEKPVCPRRHHRQRRTQHSRLPRGLRGTDALGHRLLRRHRLCLPERQPTCAELRHHEEQTDLGIYRPGRHSTLLGILQQSVNNE